MYTHMANSVLVQCDGAFPPDTLELSLKTRMKAEAIEALLYGCSTWTLRQEHYAKLLTVHHRPGLASHHRGTTQEARPSSDDLVQPCP